MRLSFSHLDSMLHRLSERLLDGELKLDEYLREFERVITFAGWTWDEFLKELDARWTSPNRKPQPAFLC